ncbi:hypothetical protein Bca4012_024245 [Brassica carinata]
MWQKQNRSSGPWRGRGEEKQQGRVFDGYITESQSSSFALPLYSAAVESLCSEWLLSADQRRKRMSSANVFGFSSSNRSKVVSEREQVGLSLRNLREFVVDVVPPRRSLLAQVCPVPHETFQLENLSEVLPSENEHHDCFLNHSRVSWLEVVSREHLSAPAKLIQIKLFLRSTLGIFCHMIVTSLPIVSGSIIDYLQMIKEKWKSCKDSEKDAVKKIWRISREGSAHVNASCQDLNAASESSSWNVDDKPCNSDRTGEVQRRPKSSAVEKEKSQSPLVAQDNAVNVGVKARKKDNLPKLSIRQTDSAIYMSYLKISKKQHQIVTGMKQSGKSIQSGALHRILGNINNLDVQPYGVFVEEEPKKLNAHWLQLVKDLPAAYAIWKKLQSQKKDVISYLERELKDKLNPRMEDEQQLQPAENPLQKRDLELDLRKNVQECLNPNQDGDLTPDAEDSGSFGQVSDENPPSDGNQITDSGCRFQVGTSPDCDNGFNLVDVEGKRYSSPISEEPHASDLEDTFPAGKNCVPELENVSSDEKIPCLTSRHGEELQFCSSGDVWQPIRQSYIGRQAYTPSGGLSIIHHPEGGEEQKKGFVDLESNMPEGVDIRKMLQRIGNNSFGSFRNNDQNELLQSLFKGQGMASLTSEQLHSFLKPPLNEEHKQIMGIGFQQEGSNNLMEGSQFSGQFQHQMTATQALSQDQQRQVDIYGQRSMSDNIYCDGRGVMMQQPDWNTSVAQNGVTTQPLVNTGPLLNQNWQSKSTNGVGCASQSSHTGTERDLNLLRTANNASQIIQRGSSSDQRIFSVFSQCSQLCRSRSAIESESSSYQVVASGNCEILMGGGSNLAQPTNPLDFLSGRQHL